MGWRGFAVLGLILGLVSGCSSTVADLRAGVAELAAAQVDQAFAAQRAGEVQGASAGLSPPRAGAASSAALNRAISRSRA